MQPIPFPEKPSVYIVEGCDGVGKTTFARKLKYRIESKKGTTPIVIVKEPAPEKLISDIFCRILQFSCIREQYFKDHVEPLLKSGTSVIYDRCYHSTFVYQCMYEATHTIMHNQHNFPDFDTSYGVTTDMFKTIKTGAIKYIKKLPPDFINGKVPKVIPIGYRLCFFDILRNDFKKMLFKADAGILRDNRDCYLFISRNIEKSNVPKADIDRSNVPKANIEKINIDTYRSFYDNMSDYMRSFICEEYYLCFLMEKYDRKNVFNVLL